MVESWLVAHALPPGITTTTLHNVTEETDEATDEKSGQLTQASSSADASSSASGETAASSIAAGSQLKSGIQQILENRGIKSGASTAAGSKNNSGSGTPVRKISAHEFERGGLTKPLVTTVDGAPTFLSPYPSSSECFEGGRAQLIRKRSTIDIQGLNETDLILELVKDICNDLDIKSLCHKILQNVGILTNADT